MKRVGLAVLFALGAYVIAAIAGYFLIEGSSSNTHDRSLEAAMTGVFVVGPLGAIIGFVVGFIRGGSAGATSAKR